MEKSIIEKKIEYKKWIDEEKEQFESAKAVVVDKLSSFWGGTKYLIQLDDCSTAIIYPSDIISVL